MKKNFKSEEANSKTNDKENFKKSQEVYALGIDLGTTRSCISVYFKGAEKPEIIPNSLGDRITPSFVYIKPSGTYEVGNSARKKALVDSSKVVSSIKRHMGEKNFIININNKNYTPEEISSMILRYLSNCARNFLSIHSSIKVKCVITVPAYFDDIQRKATINAGKIAGLDVLRIINEPTAAALAYRLDQLTSGTEKFLVYDFGGGTLDISLLECSEGMFTVLSTSGDNFLGGDDFDQIIYKYLLKCFKENNHLDLEKENDLNCLQRILQASEEAKIQLSSNISVSVDIPYLYNKNGKNYHLNVDITRSKFNDLSKLLFERSRKPIDEILKDVKIVVSEIFAVVLVGGSTRIPYIENLLKKIFSTSKFLKNKNPDEVVAEGAAIQASIILGLSSDKIVLMDTTPFNLGIEVSDGSLAPIVRKSSRIPVTSNQEFTVVEDGQTQVLIKVYQGNRTLAKTNRYLGEFLLSGLLNTKKYETKIIVSFDLNLDGILVVKAKDDKTGIENKLKILDSQSLSDDEIDKMKKEAQNFSEKDKEIKEYLSQLNIIQKTLISIENGILKKDFLKDKSDLQNEFKTLNFEFMELQNKAEFLKEKDIASFKDKLQVYVKKLEKILIENKKKTKEKSTYNTTSETKNKQETKNKNENNDFNSKKDKKNNTKKKKTNFKKKE